MTYSINIQIVDNNGELPSVALLKKWCTATLTQQKIKTAEICIRIVNKKESAALNKTYRNKKGATNVLSFPADITSALAKTIQSSWLGDLVICAPLVNEEAGEQKKIAKAHWAHLVVHGTLHLLGYDHLKKKDAIKMEAMEIKILYQLGFDNPYN
jgi:probable rRNA maturation factor